MGGKNTTDFLKETSSWCEAACHPAKFKDQFNLLQLRRWPTLGFGWQEYKRSLYFTLL